MLDQVGLVGNMSTGFGQNTVMAPTQKTPNLEEASQDFVSMLYTYMFRQMRESGSDEENGLFSGPHVNMMMGFLDQEVGKKLAMGEGKGLAQALYRQIGGKPAVAQADAKVAEVAGQESEQQSAVQDAGSTALVEAPTVLTQAGNQIQELTQKQPEVIDNSQQIMDELYKINRR